ncbi:hypothetical protein Y032_0034g2910 [Ancylostoma ceylanicum]|uniref:Uncharacterized protein n=1 Tax=Ancylostoma ceylanicum TaxID=53326 RepID=A0A016UM73_9BILA|nr:hypothetical protein Y032_0034g2910 [Ancylostoma ceylanicum]
MPHFCELVRFERCIILLKRLRVWKRSVANKRNLLLTESSGTWRLCLTNILVTTFPAFDRIDNTRSHAVPSSAKWANYAIGCCADTISSDVFFS